MKDTLHRSDKLVNLLIYDVARIFSGIVAFD